MERKGMNGLRIGVTCGLVATLCAGALAAWEPAEGAADPCAASLSEKVREMVIQLKDRGWVGVELGEGEAPVLTRVVAGSPAEEAGLEVGDLWVGVGDFEFAGKTREEVMQRLKPMIQPGNEFTVHIQRGERRLKRGADWRRHRGRGTATWLRAWSLGCRGLRRRLGDWRLRRVGGLAAAHRGYPRRRRHAGELRDHVLDPHLAVAGAEAGIGTGAARGDAVEPAYLRCEGL